MRGSVFSESWFKVSNLKVSLNTNKHIKKQIYRGEVWYVIEDIYNDQFFKIKPEAYEFIIRLDHNKTVEQVWEECLKISPLIAPTQDEVISLLTSLHHKNLLYFTNRSDNEQLVERDKTRKMSEMKGKLFSFLYFKIPLFDPDRLLDISKPFIKVVFSKIGFVVWFFTLLIGLKYTIENFSLLADETQGMLSPANIFLLYINIIFLKSFHEIGHAMMVKKFGGRVNTMGVMILIMTPIPFMDATQSWLFRSRFQRVLVGAAGMIVELFFAAIAAVVWANTGDGIIHSIAFNIMLIGSISSIFFNGNPLLRFDSYFILSDFLEIPNFYEKSKKQFYYFVEKYIFRLTHLVSPSNSNIESFWLYSYAILSYMYRLLVSLLIALFVADQWFALGVLVVLISVYMWILKPIFAFLKYLFSGDKIYKVRFKTIAISGLFVFTMLIIIAIIPFPFSIKANGIIMTNNYSSVYLKANSTLDSIVVKNGELIKKGDIIAKFSNRELDFEIANLKSSKKETSAYILRARANAKADLVPIFTHMKLLDDKINFLIKKKEDLIIKANIGGYFIYENIEFREKTWFKLGTKLGTIVPLKGVHFQAVVPQEKSYNLFNKNNLTGTIKLHGLNEHLIETKSLEIIPFEKQELPSAALGWLGGGDMATSNKDGTGTKTIESFFEVRAKIIRIDNLMLYHGRSGVLKIKLEPLTLLERTELLLTQLLQKHYKI